MRALEKTLRRYGADEADPSDVYGEIFHIGDGLIQRKGEKSDPELPPKANPVGVFEQNGRMLHRILFEDTLPDDIKVMQRSPFAVLGGLTYFGGRNKMDHASKAHALIFDMDSPTSPKLQNFFNMCQAGMLPMPNYIALSGHGLHLYYQLEEPVLLFPDIKEQLAKLKKDLTGQLWPVLSRLKNIQYQGIGQGFRVIGGNTKIEGRRVQAFCVSPHPWPLEALNEYVAPENRVDTQRIFTGRIPISIAKKQWPDWYQRKVINKENADSQERWKIEQKVNGKDPYALYHWWMRQIKEKAVYHHRYFAVMALAIYAVKCNYPYEKALDEALGMVPYLDSLGDDPFTEKDVRAAFNCYNEDYCTFPRDTISKITAIPIKKNKRNYKSRAEHMKFMSQIRDEKDPDGEWRKKGGRKSKKELVEAYAKENPSATPTQAAKDLNISRPTVYRWWPETER